MSAIYNWYWIPFDNSSFLSLSILSCFSLIFLKIMYILTYTYIIVDIIFYICVCACKIMSVYMCVNICVFNQDYNMVISFSRLNNKYYHEFNLPQGQAQGFIVGTYWTKTLLLQIFTSWCVFFVSHKQLLNILSLHLPIYLYLLCDIDLFSIWTLRNLLW